MIFFSSLEIYFCLYFIVYHLSIESGFVIVSNHFTAYCILFFNLVYWPHFSIMHKFTSRYWVEELSRLQCTLSINHFQVISRKIWNRVQQIIEFTGQTTKRNKFIVSFCGLTCKQFEIEKNMMKTPETKNCISQLKPLKTPLKDWDPECNREARDFKN